MFTIRELITKWGFSVDDKALDRVDRKLANVRGRADAVGAMATKALVRPAGLLGDLPASISMITSSARSARNLVLGLGAAFAANTFALGGFFKLIGNFEQIDIAFETLIGDADKARKTLAALKEFARTTPFNFGDVAELSKRLLAFGFAADDLIPIMTTLGNIAAGVGKDKLPQLVLALGQVKAATKLRGQELRQFTEAGVPLIGELAKTLGKPETAIQKMVSAGQIGYGDVEKALVNVTSAGGRFNNLMAKQSRSLLGIVSNIIDTIQLLAVDLGNRGLLKRAKEFAGNVLGVLEVHREKILDGLMAAADMLIMSLENMIRLAKASWQVFRGLATMVGGTRHAIELLIKSMLLLTGARMLFLLGKFGLGVLGVMRSFIMLGDAALVAQAKVALIPLAIGAAIAGLALIIEDVVAYFQGRKSITGLILADLDNLGAGLAKVIDPILKKVEEFGKTVGKSLIDGLSSLTSADWSKVGDVMMQALGFLLDASQIPLKIGLAIANGIIDGLAQGLQEKFPEFANFLGIGKGGIAAGGLKDAGPTPPVDATGTKLFGMSAIDALRAVAEAAGISTATPASAGAFPGRQIKGNGGGNSITITSPITVTVPPGTAPEKVGPIITEGLKQSLQGLMRETGRATAPAVSY